MSSNNLTGVPQKIFMIRQNRRVGQAANIQAVVVIIANVFISMQFNPVDPPISESGFRVRLPSPAFDGLCRAFD